MILVALGMVAFMGFAALAVDLGHAYSERRFAQNAADSAAMAGIRKVRTSPPDTLGSVIYDEIVRVASLNGNAQVDGANTLFLDVNGASLGRVDTYTGLLDQVAGVRVRTQIQYNTFFAGIVGVRSMTSSGRADSMSLAPSVVNLGLRPLAAKKQNWDPNTEYPLWGKGEIDIPWVDLNGGSRANQVDSWLTYGFPQPGDQFGYYTSLSGSEIDSSSLPVPSYLGTDPGARNNDYVAALALTDPVPILVYDNDVSSDGMYHIVGVAEFRVTSGEWGDDKEIEGKFVRNVPLYDASSMVTTGDLFTVRLVPTNAALVTQEPTLTPTATPTPTPTPGGPTPTFTPTPTPTATPTPSVPNAPSNLVVAAVDKYTITLTWQDNSTDETGFHIERSDDGLTGWTLVGSVGANVVTYTDTGLTHKTTYYYRIKAYNGAGDSAPTQPPVAGTTTP